IWTIRMRSSSMILRKCRTENPASSAALGISRNVLFGESASVVFISVLLCGGRICIWVAVLLLGHKRVTIIGWRHEVFLDCSRADQAKQIHHRACLIIGSAGARSAKRLLSNDSTCGFIVDVEIAGCKAKRPMGVRNRGAISAKNTASQTVR